MKKNSAPNLSIEDKRIQTLFALNDSEIAISRLLFYYLIKKFI